VASIRVGDGVALFRLWSSEDKAGFAAYAASLLDRWRAAGLSGAVREAEEALGLTPKSPEPAESLQRGLVTFHGFRPSARSPPSKLLQEIPSADMGSLLLSRRIRREIDRVVREFSLSAKLVEAGLRPSNRVLLHGPPGTGKTTVAAAIAKEMSLQCFQVRLASVISSYQGESAKLVEEIWEYARTSQCVLLLDEVDSLLTSRGRTRGEDSAARQNWDLATNVLLMGLDRFGVGSFLIGTTNRPAVLDKAVWRRFDSVIRFPNPTDPQIRSLVGKLAGTEAPPAMLGRGMSFADVERICLRSRKIVVLGDAEGKSLGDVLALEAERDFRERQRAIGKGRRGKLSGAPVSG
jgi:SpoVK/Ycf46/Vps4 family AAA+-type ATPase